MGRSPIDESGCLVQTGTRSPLFITFEGTEGSGKSTQSLQLADYLRCQNYPVVYAREPGGTSIADVLRELVLQKDGTGISDRVEVLLFNASRASLVGEVLRPALAEGKIVICDRYTDSTIAYQCYGRGLPVVEVTQINRFAADGLRPELVFLLDLAPEVGLTRRVRDGADWTRFEMEELEYHQRVVDGYRVLARSDPERWRVIDASKDVDAIKGEIRDVTERELAVRGVIAPDVDLGG